MEYGEERPSEETRTYPACIFRRGPSGAPGRDLTKYSPAVLSAQTIAGTQRKEIIIVHRTDAQTPVCHDREKSRDAEENRIVYEKAKPSSSAAGCCRIITLTPSPPRMGSANDPQDHRAKERGVVRCCLLRKIGGKSRCAVERKCTLEALVTEL